MGTDDIPYGYRKFFSLMDKVKSCTNKMSNKRKKSRNQLFSFKHSTSIISHFFTGNILFLRHDLIFEMFLSILLAFVQKLGRSTQIHTTGIFYDQRPYKNQFFVTKTEIFYQILTKYCLNNDTLDLMSAT